MLGDPIAHSLSPALHRAGYAAAGLAWEYDAVRIAHDVAIELVRREGAHALRLERDAQLAGCEPAAHEDCWSGVYHERIL